MNASTLPLKTPAFVAAVALSLFLIGLAGCGSDVPETARVFGRVTYQGRPVASDPANHLECEIRFWPEDGRRPALGQLDAEGNYRLSSFGQNDGAIPGKYIVTIKAVKVHLPEGGKDGWLEWIVPEKFENQETSGLTAAVEPGKNEINFDLTAEQ